MAIGSILQIYPFDFKPSAPPAGQFIIYVKTDNTIYIQDSAGTEFAFGSTTSITQLSGEATGIGPGNAVVTLSNSAVIGKILTGFTPGPNSTVLATDTILQATQKLQSQINSVSGTTLTGDVTGSFSATVVSFVGGKTATQVATSVNDTLAATASNTASTIVKRDASGNFAANIITASLNGNATTSTTTTNFTGSLSGDVTGTQGSTVVATVGGKSAASITTSVNDTQAATSVNTASTIVKRDISGNFSANTITANLTGSASNNVLKSGDTITGTLNITGAGTALDVTNNAHVGGNLTVDGTVTASNISGSNSGDVTVTDTANIDLTLTGQNIQADLIVTGVTAASYGTATQVGSFTVDNKGRLSAASNTSIAIPSTQVTDFNEASQDAVGIILTDTNSIDFTYTDGGPSITADVRISNSTLTIDAGGVKVATGGITDNEVTSGIDAIKIGTGIVSNTEYGYLDGVTSAIQTQINSKYDASNPNGYETPSQLNARDTANRARINHTGTQLSTTISDFNEASQDAVAASLSNTSTINFTYNDVGNLITADVNVGSITDSLLASGINANKISSGIISNTEFNYLDGLTSNIQTQINSITGSGITSLTGDVTGTGPGATATTVISVGTSSATNIHTAELAANAATPTNTPSTIVKRDASGDFSTGLINGVSVQAHASRHLPSGADPLTTAAAITLDANSTNTVGTNNSLSRSDHTHDLSTGTVSTQTPDQANTEGSSANLARADHTHNIPSGSVVQIGTSNFNGATASFALADHIHAHGNQTNGTLHAAATTSVNGFMSAADKTKLDNATASNTVSTLVFRDSNGDTAVRDLTQRNSLQTGFTELTEQAAPSTPSATKTRVYSEAFNGFTRIRNLDSTGYISTINRDIIFLTKNITGSTILKGKIVYVNGSDSVNGTVTIALAQANSSTTSPAFGLVVEDIANNAFGRVLSIGIATNLDTSAFTDGQRVYLSSTVAGGLTATKPSSPNIWQRIGVIIKAHATLGIIEIRPLATHGEESGTNTGFTLNTVALTDAPTITTDASLGNVFKVTLAGNRTLAAPTNPIDGQKITFRITQDATGNRTLAFDPIFRFGLDIISVVLSTAGNKTDYIGCQYNATSSKWDVLAVSKAF